MIEAELKTASCASPRSQEYYEVVFILEGVLASHIPEAHTTHDAVFKKYRIPGPLSNVIDFLRNSIKFYEEQGYRIKQIIITRCSE